MLCCGVTLFVRGAGIMKSCRSGSAMREEWHLAPRQLRPSWSKSPDTPLPAQQSCFLRHLYLGLAQQLAGRLRLRMSLAPPQPPPTPSDAIPPMTTSSLMPSGRQLILVDLRCHAVQLAVHPGFSSPCANPSGTTGVGEHAVGRSAAHGGCNTLFQPTTSMACK